MRRLRHRRGRRQDLMRRHMRLWRCLLVCPMASILPPGFESTRLRVRMMRRCSWAADRAHTGTGRPRARPPDALHRLRMLMLRLLMHRRPRRGQLEPNRAASPPRFPVVSSSRIVSPCHTTPGPGALGASAIGGGHQRPGRRYHGSGSWRGAPATHWPGRRQQWVNRPGWPRREPTQAHDAPIGVPVGAAFLRLPLVCLVSSILLPGNGGGGGQGRRGGCG